MAVIHRDHLSLEGGHTSGISRVLVDGGLALVVIGVLAFVAAAVWGIVAAGSGSVIGSGSTRLLAAGGGSVVGGTVLAAAGITLGRRIAGE